MSTDKLIELWVAGLDEADAIEVQEVFDLWGRGGAVVEQLGEAGSSATLLVKTYLRPEEEEALRQIEIALALVNKMRQSQGHSTLPELQQRTLADADWAESWKANYHVLHLGRRLVIKPSWREYSGKSDDVIIELDPGMAFGSGLHPTSQLCLLALEDMVTPGMRVLDVGTGSGILAIAAAKLGARYVHGLDNDPMAVRVAQQNVVDNGGKEVISIVEGTLPSEPVAGSDGILGQWDLIVANILANPLMEMAPAFHRNLTSGGILILSGINNDQIGTVTASMERSSLSAVGSSLQGEWAALFFKK